jgi:hypothetical protein
VPGLNPHLAGQLLSCAHSTSTMPRKAIATNVHALGDDEQARPVLDLAVWPSIAAQFKLGDLPFPVPMSFANNTTQNFAQFEERAFQVVGFVCELLSNPCVELSDFKTEMGKSNTRFDLAWGGCSDSRCLRYALEETKQHYQPFDGCKSHESAAAGALSEEFLRRMRKLSDTGAPRSMLLWTGGSAPFDYVRVHLVDEATKKVTIALGDAKHKSGPATGARSQANVVEDAKSLGAKALPWFTGMKRELEKLHYDVDGKFSVSLITNIDTPDYKAAGVQCDNLVEVVILSPTNFTFKPWTDLLFRCVTRPAQ